MSDPYLNTRRVVDRLIEEWEKYGSLIIAVDYDDTLFDFHKKGYTYDNVIELLRRCKAFGAKIIIFTCCGPDQHEDITAYLQANEIPFDAINEDLLPQPFKGRKVYYNHMLDDRAGLMSAYMDLLAAVHYMERKTQDA